MCEMCPVVARERDELEERVRQLEAVLFNKAWEPPAELRLTRMEIDIIRAMLRSERPHSKEFLVEASRGPHSFKQDPEPKIIDTVMFKIRQKLAPHGLFVETVWGRGYRLAPESRERLQHWRTSTVPEASGKDAA